MKWLKIRESRLSCFSYLERDDATFRRSCPLAVGRVPFAIPTLARSLPRPHDVSFVFSPFILQQRTYYLYETYNLTTREWSAVWLAHFIGGLGPSRIWNFKENEEKKETKYARRRRRLATD